MAKILSLLMERWVGMVIIDFQPQLFDVIYNLEMILRSPHIIGFILRILIN